MKAATDPSHRPQFYRDLLSSEVFLVSASDDCPSIEDGVAKAGDKLLMQPVHFEGEDWLPVFSSLSRLQQSLQGTATYLQLSARDFLETTRGANVILNPGLDYGKGLTASEIERMLDGTILQSNEQHTYEKDTSVLIGQPAEYPSALVDALSRLFARHNNIKAAFLAQYLDAERDERPHTLVGIDVSTDDMESIVGEAGMVAEDVMPDGEIVDFIRVSAEESGLSQYLLRETKPFYKRSLFRRLFGG